MHEADVLGVAIPHLKSISTYAAMLNGETVTKRRAKKREAFDIVADDSVFAPVPKAKKPRVKKAAAVVDVCRGDESEAEPVSSRVCSEGSESAAESGGDDVIEDANTNMEDVGVGGADNGSCEAGVGDGDAPNEDVDHAPCDVVELEAAASAPGGGDAHSTSNSSFSSSSSSSSDNIPDIVVRR